MTLHNDKLVKFMICLFEWTDKYNKGKEESKYRIHFRKKQERWSVELRIPMHREIERNKGRKRERERLNDW